MKVIAIEDTNIVHFERDVEIEDTQVLVLEKVKVFTFEIIYFLSNGNG